MGRFKPQIGLFTDGSFYPAHGRGAWAAWTKQDGSPGTFHSGVLKEPIKTAREAEMFAIANGVMLASKLAQDRPRLFLQSDSLEALGRILTRMYDHVRDRPAERGRSILPVRAENMESEVRALNTIEGLCRKHFCVVMLRHVKGHSKNTDGRFGVNNRCDELCTEEMQAWIKGKELCA